MVHVSWRQWLCHQLQQASLDQQLDRPVLLCPSLLAADLACPWQWAQLGKGKLFPGIRVTQQASVP